MCVLLLFWGNLAFSQGNSEWVGSVTFPGNFKVGDYREFIKAFPINESASGYYEISISYTRGNVAAGSTFLTSISHSNNATWRELGKINNNGYLTSEGTCFVVDCNPGAGDARFRLRATKVLGTTTSPLTVNIKIRSINLNSGWTELTNTGTDVTAKKIQPMTDDWSLYVGNGHSTEDAKLAIKAIENGNVGIGYSRPGEKLSVNGNIRAHEIKVETQNWPDYVFEADYPLLSLESLRGHITKTKHLPGVPTAKEIEREGLSVGEMNKILMKKIEELTLYLLEMNATLKQQQGELEKLKKAVTKQ